MPNESGRERCVRCAGTLSDATPAAKGLTGGRDAADFREELLSLTSGEGRVIHVRSGDVVGRTAAGREVLEIHEEISRRHAEFVIEDGGWFIIDLGASNGTFLDGKRIPPREKTPLRNGQQIMLSPVFQAVITIQGASQEKVPPPAETAEEGDGRKTMVVLFADLKGSVDFFQEKGTIVARNWIVTLYRMLSSIIDAHRGEHIKNIGDAILAVFEDPIEAAKAAVDMQADLRKHNLGVDETGRYYLRIGMNRGPVLFEERDIFGNAVNIASRVQAFAPPERIFITEQLYREIKDAEGLKCRFISREQLKGVKEKTGIYEILCGDTISYKGEGNAPKPCEEAP